MTEHSLRSMLVGAGMVAAGYADDEKMAQYVRFASHAQVLSALTEFEWGAVVDRSCEAAESVASKYSVAIADSDIEAAVRRYSPEVVVLAIPSKGRLEVIKSCPDLRGVIVEKPIGSTIREAEALLDYCGNRSIAVQVNSWRRADPTMRDLMGDKFQKTVGSPQAIVCLYGNGLYNNAIHMVDVIRMFGEEFQRVRAAGLPRPITPGWSVPVAKDDFDVFFTASTRSGASAAFHPISFRHYRENGFDIWGTGGRLSVLREGMLVETFSRHPNRAVSGEGEIASDDPTILASGVSDAFAGIYRNLSDHICSGAELWSPGSEALESLKVISAVDRSSQLGGVEVPLG